METILYEKRGHVAHITLNQPHKLNALGRALARELNQAWEDFRDDDNLWVGILAGKGPSFCAGADLKEMERGKWRFRDSLDSQEAKRSL